MNSTQTAFGTYAHLPKIFKTFTTTSGGLPESGRMTSTPANVQKKISVGFSENVHTVHKQLFKYV